LISWAAMTLGAVSSPTFFMALWCSLAPPRTAAQNSTASSQTADAQEGMASFLEKRPAKWVDR